MNSQTTAVNKSTACTRQHFLSHKV